MVMPPAGTDSSESPTIAWHPDQPLLLVVNEGAVRRWTPDGVSAMDGLPAAAAYRYLAFSPDGQTLWAFPSPEAMQDRWRPSSDAIDLASGTVRAGWGWDTGVARHPGGGLVLTFQSDQGATYGLFARVDHGTRPAAMRVLSRALILDCDRYETPVFSADGRHFAIRGNAYDNSVEVFEFPSLTRVLATTLGEPEPGLSAIRTNGVSRCAPGHGTTSPSGQSPACCGSGRRPGPSSKST